MRILSWVQNKLSGSQEKKKFDGGSCSSRPIQRASDQCIDYCIPYSAGTSIPDVRKEEFDDWPQSFLSIGTFGNTKEGQERPNPPENLDLQDFSAEEVVKLQKELIKLLTNKPKTSEKGEGRGNHPLNRFLNCPSSLEVERRDGESNGDPSPDSRIMLNQAKDILADGCNAMRRKSLSFLLKKMFVCSGGSAPVPSLRDPIPESRMEKLLRVMLHKQIHPQSSSKTATPKFLEKKTILRKIGYKDEMREKEEDGSKWVKTDSEYIVLEI